jgi:AcrR family transcriptional regulator
MPRQSRQTKRRIIDAAYELFYKGGFARASVDDIAAAAGITKRTFYYHFDSKQTLIAAALGIQDELALAQIQHWAKRVAGDPIAMVEKLFTEFATWAKKPGWRSSGFTRAAMEFAHSPGHPALRAARRHKAAVENWLTGQFAETGIKTPQTLARQVLLLIEGCNSLVLIHSDLDYANAAREAARLLVEQRASTRSTTKRAKSSSARRAHRPRVLMSE